jgi:hypothetical protein
MGAALARTQASCFLSRAPRAAASGGVVVDAFCLGGRLSQSSLAGEVAFGRRAAVRGYGREPVPGTCQVDGSRKGAAYRQPEDDKAAGAGVASSGRRPATTAAPLRAHVSAAGVASRS